ncbi:hypothetical protein [uncultured Lacinutrix sp.]|uniref:tetratricopeptide repeat protein n=1 Tax=uncultured Lacinutrix sp. TaxID=574032 RepID=UPI0026098315|nr:hypothetical protein [uncultured Lacinutrix sp.]
MEVKLTDALLKQIDDYIKGGMMDDDRLSFEKEMEQNTALKDEVILQQELITLIGLEEWVSFRNTKENEDLRALKEQLRSKTFQDASKKIKQIGLDNYKEKKEKIEEKKRKFPFYYIPAAVILLFISVFFMNRNSGLDSYYKDYANWNKELSSFIVKNSDTSAFSNGEIAFKNKNYTSALKYFKTIKRNNKLYPYSLMYIGASYELENENKKALATFDQLITLNTFEEHTKGYWYKLLIYLKLNDKKNVEETLNTILQNKENYHYEEAILLSSKIK